MTTREDVQAKVQRILASNFNAQLGPDGNSFVIRLESTGVSVSVDKNPLQAQDEDIWMVRVLAPILRDIELSDELAREIATTQKRLGSINWSDNVVSINQNLVGNTLDEHELGLTVAIVGAVADQLDDEWQARFGGRKLSD